MVEFNKNVPSLIYLVLMFCILFVGCDSNSSGSKETQQLDNDNDPTAIENLEGPKPLLKENTVEIDPNGEFVVIQEFDQDNWQKVRQEYKLDTIVDPSMTGINSRSIGGGEWKPWGEYQYRVIYFSEGGELKAKPLLKNKDNIEIAFSSQAIDSLRIRNLWIEIQRNSSTISNNYK